MKLLMTADAVGGVWQYATELAAALVPHGVATVIAVMGPMPSPPVCPEPVDGRASDGALPGSSFDRLGTNGVEVVHTGLPLDWLADGPAPVRDAAARIAAMAREIGADLVHLNSPALAAAAAFPCPVVAVAHGCIATWWDAAEATPLPDTFGWLAAMTRDGLAAASAVVAPSASYAAVVQRRYGLPRAPVVVHNGRSAPRSAETAPPADHVLTAGRLWDRVKNTALLDAVASRLPVPFLAAGPVTAPQGDTVRPAHLALLGTLPAADLARELAQRPVFVSAASFEPFGLAVLEAAQAGCALVLSDIATFRELWDGAALFVQGWEPQDWAGALAALLADPARRQALGRQAADRAARHTPAATAAAMMRAYAGVLPRAERAAA